MVKIGIIYIVTGAYCKFWNIFYESMEKFFCIDADKGYEVFTDSLDLLGKEYPNVNFHQIADRGWIENVSSKSQCICNIRDSLLKYDYIFYLNGNYNVSSEIKSEEILPVSSDGWLTALSYQHYKDISPDEYPYDRNPACRAYIPYGQGQFYYQGGFYGGRTKEMLLMADCCKIQIRQDLDKGIVARFHDESYLNKYLLEYSPKRLDELYAFHQIWDYNGIYKAVFLDQYEFLGDAVILAQKGKYGEEIDLKRIVTNVMLHGSFVKSLGLFNGKMGIILFLYTYARFSKERKCEDFANDFLDSYLEELFVSNLPLNIKDGLAGIGLGIEYLVRQRYVEGNTDEILKELDYKIMECAPLRLIDSSFDSGLEGILYYVFCRLNAPHDNYLPFNDEFLNEIRQVCCSAKISLFSDKVQEMCGLYLQNGKITDVSFDVVFHNLFRENEQRSIMSWQKGLEKILIR